MKNNKGFTLIELLAVIVILAIIALIATPIVLGIIDDSKASALKVSATYIVDAVEKAYSMAYTINQGSAPHLSQVRESFDMKGALWAEHAETDGDHEGEYKIYTKDEEVVCWVKSVEKVLVVDCPEYEGVTSRSMSINVTTENVQTP